MCRTGYLRQLRVVPGNRLDSPQVVRLVQWTQRNESLQRRDHLGRDKYRADELYPAVQDAMPHRGDAVSAEGSAVAPVEEKFNRPLMPQRSPGRPVMLADDMACGVAGHEVRSCPDPFDLTVEQ
jgi:hypothetical protein